VRKILLHVLVAHVVATLAITNKLHRLEEKRIGVNDQPAGQEPWDNEAGVKFEELLKVPSAPFNGANVGGKVLDAKRIDRLVYEVYC
jgi:hypothetical protein